MFLLRRGDAASRRRTRRGEQNMVIVDVDVDDDGATTKMVNDNAEEKKLWGDSELR